MVVLARGRRTEMFLGSVGRSVEREDSSNTPIVVGESIRCHACVDESVRAQQEARGKLSSSSSLNKLSSSRLALPLVSALADDVTGDQRIASNIEV